MIKKLDPNMHLVLKWADLNELDEEKRKQLSEIITAVRFNRLGKGKKELNDYVALNLDNEIDLDHLIEALKGISYRQKWNNYTGYKATIRLIAADIVDAIMFPKRLEEMSKALKGECDGRQGTQ